MPPEATTEAGSRSFPAAVLWDLDGTLVETEHYWWDSEKDLVAEFGGVWTDDDARALVGGALTTSAEVIQAKTPVTLDVPRIVERMIDGVIARMRHALPWRPGAWELVRELNTCGVPCAMVTMSWQRLTETVLGGVPEGTFQVVVSGDAVRHGKPHPEAYLTAAARLGVPIGACVAIEDSANGMRSAHASGARTIVVPNVVPVIAPPGVTVVKTLAGLRAAELMPLTDSVVC